MDLPVDHADALSEGEFLRWYDLREKPALVEITKVDRRELTLEGGVTKIKGVIELKQIQGSIENIKPLVLNKTNTGKIVSFLGNRPSKWVGHQIVLFQDTTKLRGKPTECIRIRAPKK
jgi:hypothetical protein